MKNYILALLTVLAPLVLLPGLATAQAQKADFGGGESPYVATIVLKNVDLETTANFDVDLPANFKYIVQSVQTVSRTAPSAVTTPARLGLSSVSGGTATAIRGSVAVESNAAGEVATVFASSPTSNGYFYTEDVAASTTTGLCTENVTLNTPGAIAGEASPLHPRKLVITTVDNAGDNLAGTVTLSGTNAQGESITEVVTIVAGTDTHATTSAFATFITGTHDFGATGQVTVDTLNIGMSVQVALPSKTEFAYNGKTVRRVVKVSAPLTVFNVTTENHTFFVEKVLTHNCDSAGTWHKDYVPDKINRMTVEGLVAEAVASCAPFVVITGGEPCAQPHLPALCAALKAAGIPAHIETSGGFPAPLEDVAWLTVSPKREHLPDRGMLEAADEIKLIVDSPQAADEWVHTLSSISGPELFDVGTPVWLHPEWSKREDPATLAAITSYVRDHGDPFRAGWQMHKLFRADALDPRTAPLAPLGGDPARGY